MTYDIQLLNSDGPFTLCCYFIDLSLDWYQKLKSFCFVLFFSQWVEIAHLEAFIVKRQWGFEACLADCSSICWVGSFVSDKTEILSVRIAGFKSSWAQEKARKKIIETQLSNILLGSYSMLFSLNSCHLMGLHQKKVCSSVVTSSTPVNFSSV